MKGRNNLVRVAGLGLLATFSSLAPSRASEGTAGGPASPALVVLVRHAEKAAEPREDPPLTPAGNKRAAALAQALQDAGVTAVITSDALRARETARPLAEARGVKPRLVGFGSGGVEAHVAEVAAEVRRQAAGVVVVVGHSNTIPLIIAALGGPRLPKIPETEYAHLFILVPGPDAAHLVQSSYGAADGR